MREAYSSIQSSGAAAQLVKSLAKNPHCSIGTMKLPSGDYTKDTDSTLKHFIEFHFPGSFVAPNNDRATVPSNVLTRGDVNIAKAIVSKDKIKWAVPE